MLHFCIWTVFMSWCINVWLYRVWLNIISRHICTISPKYANIFVPDFAHFLAGCCLQFQVSCIIYFSCAKMMQNLAQKYLHISEKLWFCVGIFCFAAPCNVSRTYWVFVMCVSVSNAVCVCVLCDFCVCHQRCCLVVPVGMFSYSVECMSVSG